jgi:hypothetical protein
MSELTLYVAEASVLLAVFYLVYLSMLSKETFFHLNRIVLLIIPLLSLAIPLLRVDFSDVPAIPVDQPLASISTLSRSYYDAMASWEFEVGSEHTSTTTTENALTWRHALVYSFILIYFGGVLICLSRTVWSVRWVMKVLSNHTPVESSGIKLVKVSYPTAPFSFLNYVFVHAPFAESTDFRQVLDHERTHIEEKHTIDLIYVQLVAALFWFNPFIWQLLKSLKIIHEYIADRKIIQSGYSVIEYQTLLLRQLISNNSSELVHNFNLSFIKKRITMMTSKESGWAGRTRVGIAIAAMLCCSALIMRCNTKIDEQISPGVSAKAALGVEVPTIPPSGFRFDGDISNALTFTIIDNTLRIGDKAAEIPDINSIKDDSGRDLPIIMMVDKDQPMGFVRRVHTALREADRRKLLYVAKTETGERVELSLILPPDPKKVSLPDLSQIPEDRLLKIDMGKNEGAANQQKVYDFVTSFHIKGQAELPVVSATFDDQVSYEVYLSNFFYVKEGYIQLYQERAHKMFGKDFYETTREEYQAVRENIPTNISIAEE